jgi:hypothetical protein
MPWDYRKILPALLAAVLWIGGPLPAWAQADLFSSVFSQRTLSRALEARIHRSRTVAVDFRQLDSGSERPGVKAAREPLRLNLFAGVSHTARNDLIQVTSNRVTVWKGRLEGIAHSEVTLAYKDNVLSGNISIPGARYLIRSLGDGLHAILEVNPNAYPAEKDPRPVALAAVPGEPALPRDAFTAGSGPIGAGGLYKLYLPTIFKPPILDVLVVYTPAARLAAGGGVAMETLVQLAVSETNTGYVNSGIRQSLNLVHAEEVGYDEIGFDWDLTLDRLTGKSEGFLDSVHVLRDTYRADAVVLLVDDGLFCGLGWLMTPAQPAFAAYAFALVNWDCATGNYSFAHELGHLMGSHHDWNTTTETGYYNYSKGYQAPDQSFRTIMAYDCQGGCPRINYWSNPEILYNGQPAGANYLGPNPADNTRSINNTTSRVVNWR